MVAAVNRLKSENKNLKQAVKKNTSELTELIMSVSQVPNLPTERQVSERPKETSELKPVRQLEKSVVLYGSNASDYSTLLYENEELIKKYVETLNRLTELEGSYEVITKKLIETARREANLLLENIHLKSDFHRLHHLVIVKLQTLRKR